MTDRSTRSRSAGSAPAIGAATLAVLAVLIAGGLTGCGNPLRPSEPEPPSTEEGSFEVTVDYDQPQSVLETLAQAVAARDRPGNGRAAYMGAFAGGSEGLPLAFTFDPDVVAERVASGKVVPSWTRALEQQFYVYLSNLHGNQELSMNWSPYADAPPDVTDESAGTATVYSQYQVVTIGSDGVSDTTIAIGRATIDFRKTTGDRWLITSWSDKILPGSNAADTEQPSFSRLRIDSTGQ